MIQTIKVFCVAIANASLGAVAGVVANKTLNPNGGQVLTGQGEDWSMSLVYVGAAVGLLATAVWWVRK